MSTLAAPSTAHTAYNYALVDVFAERALEGNQLAIFTDARGLTDLEMQALAHETNLSETTFLLPRSPQIEREHGVRVRIFTSEEELPFAGHPTLGTASWLYLNHPELRGSETLRLDLNIGSIPVRFTPPQTGEAGVFATMRQNDPIFGAPQESEALAHVLGLPLDDIDPDLPIQTVTTGNPFCLVPLRSLEALKRLTLPNTAEIAQYLKQNNAKFFYFLAPTFGSHEVSWRARMMFYGREDPATGSAAGPAIAWLLRHGRAQSGETILLEQGIEMKRPSRLTLSAQINAGEITEVFVGGRTIPVATGRFFLP